MTSLVRVQHFILLLAVLLAAPTAVADGAERQQAIEIGQTGLDLYERRQYRVALERFRTAQRVSHSPVFVLYEARCLDKLGHWLEAKRAYQTLASEQIPADAPPAWRAAINDGGRELAALSKRLPSVSLELSGATAVSLKLDGKELDRAQASGELWLDPGQHEFEARSESGRIATARVELAEGERNKLVRLTLPLEPQSATQPERRTVVPQRITVVAAHKPATDSLGVALLAGAGVGLVGGAVTGLMAASELEDVRDNCVGDRCRRSDAGAGQTVQTLALISTIAFAAGGAALGAWSLRVILTPAASEKSVSRVEIVHTF